MSVSIDDQIKCVEREITMRQKVYPRWVRAGQMSQIEADLELRRMRAVLATLKELRQAQQGDLFTRTVPVEKTGVGKLAP